MSLQLHVSLVRKC